MAKHPRKCTHKGFLRATTAASSLTSECIFSTLALSMLGNRKHCCSQSASLDFWFAPEICRDHRIIEWPGLKRTTVIIEFQPPAMCRVTTNQSHIRPGLECLQGCGIHSLLGQPVQCDTTLCVKNFLLISNRCYFHDVGAGKRRWDWTEVSNVLRTWSASCYTATFL